MEVSADYLLSTHEHCSSIFEANAANNNTWSIGITYTLHI